MHSRRFRHISQMQPFVPDFLRSVHDCSDLLSDRCASDRTSANFGFSFTIAAARPEQPAYPHSHHSYFPEALPEWLLLFIASTQTFAGYSRKTPINSPVPPTIAAAIKIPDIISYVLLKSVSPRIRKRNHINPCYQHDRSSLKGFRNIIVLDFHGFSHQYDCNQESDCCATPLTTPAPML